MQNSSYLVKNNLLQSVFTLFNFKSRTIKLLAEILKDIQYNFTDPAKKMTFKFKRSQRYKVFGEIKNSSALQLTVAGKSY